MTLADPATIAALAVALAALVVTVASGLSSIATEIRHTRWVLVDIRSLIEHEVHHPDGALYRDEDIDPDGEGS